MKRVIFSLIAVLFAFVAVNAQVTDTTRQRQQTQPGINQGQQDDYVRIRIEELPDEVQTTLEGNEYNNWEVSNAYRSNTTGNYRIEVRNGAQTKMLMFDEEGKLLKNKEDKQGMKPKQKSGSERDY